jgi:hypothetical protein
MATAQSEVSAAQHEAFRRALKRLLCATPRAIFAARSGMMLRRRMPINALPKISKKASPAMTRYFMAS